MQLCARGSQRISISIMITGDTNLHPQINDSTDTLDSALGSDERLNMASEELRDLSWSSPKYLST